MPTYRTPVQRRRRPAAYPPSTASLASYLSPGTPAESINQQQQVQHQQMSPAESVATDNTRTPGTRAEQAHYRDIWDNGTWPEIVAVAGGQNRSSPDEHHWAQPETPVFRNDEMEVEPTPQSESPYQHFLHPQQQSYSAVQYTPSNYSEQTDDDRTPRPRWPYFVPDIAETRTRNRQLQSAFMNAADARARAHEAALAREQELERQIQDERRRARCQEQYNVIQEDIRQHKAVVAEANDRIQKTLKDWFKEVSEDEYGDLYGHFKRCDLVLPSVYNTFAAYLWHANVPAAIVKAVEDRIAAEEKSDFLKYEADRFFQKSQGNFDFKPPERDAFPRPQWRFGFECRTDEPKRHEHAKDSFCDFVPLEKLPLELGWRREQSYLLKSLKIRLARLEKARSEVNKHDADESNLSIFDAYHCWLDHALVWIHDRVNHPATIKAEAEQSGKTFADVDDYDQWRDFEVKFRKMAGNCLSQGKKRVWDDMVEQRHLNPMSGKWCASHGGRHVPELARSREWFEEFDSDDESSIATDSVQSTPTRSEASTPKATVGPSRDTTPTQNDPRATRTPKVRMNAPAPGSPSAITSIDGSEDSEMTDDETTPVRTAAQRKITQRTVRHMPVVGESEQDDEEDDDYDSDDAAEDEQGEGDGSGDTEMSSEDDMEE